ncbi:AraC family transcriptional regulator [Denitromonas iodatirespirans]|uniref:AraC family transcriptional regulator n=1 Tax=Denitromonas iodatirespirans TaxID=2795389 RepID=A0A944H765_DENI1|nr:AraC family transcriptional regulator [Denitromonas iodatirespirans]MBT0960908.1 AraC family transcriptional regulator [Denitromonas iodatirespirans]
MFDHPGEFVTFRPAPFLPGVELYNARLIEHAFSAHVHEGFSVGVIASGVERFHYRGSGHIADPATLVLLNPDEPHTGEAADEGGWHYHMVYLQPAAMSAIAGPQVYFPQAAVKDAALSQMLAIAFRRMWQADEPIAAQTALTDAIATIAERHGRHARPASDVAMQRFDRVVDYIEAHLDQALDLERLAAVAGLSMHHFARAFAAHFHLSPHRYVQARRVLRAKQGLAGAQRPLAVALDAGFTDQSHLTRWFRQAYGVTPAEYQQQIGTRPHSR